MELRTDRYKFKDLFPDKAKKYAQKLHIKADEIEFVRKGIPIDPKDIEIKEGERAAIRYVTTPHLDRDNEILIPTGAILDDFRQSPSVLYAHDYRGLPVGKDLWIKPTAKGILAKTQYAKHQFAEDVYQCVKGKFLNCNSVGFIPIEAVNQDDKKAFAEWQDTLEKEFEIPKDESGKAKSIYTKWIMLEHSDVPVASNAQSLNLAVSKGDLPIQSERLKKDLEIEVVKDKKDREIEVVYTAKDEAGETKKFKDKVIEVEKDDPIETITHPVAKDPQVGKTISGEQEIEIEVEKDEPGFKSKIAHLDRIVFDPGHWCVDKKGVIWMWDGGGWVGEDGIPAEKEISIKEIHVPDCQSEFKGDIGIEKAKPTFATVKLTEKVETTENYHRIPVESPDKHKGHRIRTIVISATKGIKALYCGECKRVITYLFDVNKWSMEEAKRWVSEHKRELEECIQKYFTEGIAPEKEEHKKVIKSIVEEADKELFKDPKAKRPQHKERWNKSLSKLFDVASTQSPTPLRFHYELYEKFLECKVKEIFQNGYVIPSPLLGTYLAGFKKILGEFELKDTRKFTWDGSEVPPDYEVIQLNSEKSDDFLIDGMCFYEAEKKPLIVNFSPNWSGLTVTLTTSNENKEWNKELLDKVHSWVYENNFLRGEKFSLSGDFLHEPDDDWDNLILDEKYKDSIRKSANFLEKKGKGFTGRGLLFIGPPGTGKTKTGRVLMNEMDATFIWVSSKDFRHIGPLRALALGFSLARDLAPSVLFLEDIDTWLRGEMEFVTDLIKTEMDGIKQNRGIITILTSNYPEKLPDALLDRPGRFHHIVNFELPKAEHREAMLKLWAGDIEEDLLKEITEKTDGFSGAHIKELVEFARMIAEEDEIEIGKALIMSLDKLTEQRELIEEIRGNKTDAKAVWDRVKYEKGEVKVMEEKEIEIETEEKVVVSSKDLEKAEEKQKFECECIKCDHKLTSEKHCNEIKCPECGGEMRRAERPGPGKEGYVVAKKKDIQDMIDELERNWDKLLKQKDEVIDGKDEIIADLKEGRVLSRKNRKIVKDAITALNAVLKADAAGAREDEESESGGQVTEREVELVKDTEREFSKEDIAKVIKEVSGEQMGEILKDAFKNALNPEKIKAMVSDGIRLELQKIRGKVE